jgi:hypothetical protein
VVGADRDVVGDEVGAVLDNRSRLPADDSDDSDDSGDDANTATTTAPAASATAARATHTDRRGLGADMPHPKSATGPDRVATLVRNVRGDRLRAEVTVHVRRCQQVLRVQRLLHQQHAGLRARRQRVPGAGQPQCSYGLV